MNAQEIVDRRARIEQLLGEKYSQIEIAHKLGISQGSISMDIKAIESKRAKEQDPIPSTYIQFNHFIGLPRSKPMTPYQIEIDQALDSIGKVIVNKTKKGGLTESSLRSILRRAYTRYPAGSEIMLIPGNNREHSESLIERLLDLINPRLSHTIKRYTKHSIVLNNGVLIRSYPSTPRSVVGRINVRFVYIDELGFTGEIEDQAIFENSIANLATYGGSCLITSSPNGMIKIFYDLCETAKAGKLPGWAYFEIPYTEALKYGVLDQQFVEQAKENPLIDFQQAFCCQFTRTQHSVFNVDLSATSLIDNEIEFEVFN